MSQPVSFTNEPISGESAIPDTLQWEIDARKGDRAAFERLYRRYVGRVYAICWRMCGNQAMAEELTQETFVRAWQRLDQYEPGSLFGAWVSRVAVNVVLAEARARKRRLTREATILEFPGTETTSSAAHAGHSIDLERAISQLPPGARRVFVLHDVEGFRHEEISGMLGMAVGSSKAQLHRARNTLREVLKR